MLKASVSKIVSEACHSLYKMTREEFDAHKEEHKTDGKTDRQAVIGAGGVPTIVKATCMTRHTPVDRPKGDRHRDACNHFPNNYCINFKSDKQFLSFFA
jgi:hypothetical protein